MGAAEPQAGRAVDNGRSAWSPPGSARRALSIEGILAAMRRPLMVAFLSLTALIQVYRVAAALPGRIHEEDFADYYAAATMMRQGENLYRTSLGPIGARLGLHTKNHAEDDTVPETPAFLLGLKALGALPLTRAFWTWIALNFAALIASFYFLLGPESGLRPVDACLMVSLALIYSPRVRPRPQLAPVRSMGSYVDRGSASVMAQLQYPVVRSVRADRDGGGAQPG
jgi:hypothetical protein